MVPACRLRCTCLLDIHDRLLQLVCFEYQQSEIDNKLTNMKFKVTFSKVDSKKVDVSPESYGGAAEVACPSPVETRVIRPGSSSLSIYFKSKR